MGDGEKAPLRVQFNPKVCLEFHGATITSDAGLLPIRELEMKHLDPGSDTSRFQATLHGILQTIPVVHVNIKSHHLIPLIRQSIYKTPLLSRVYDSISPSTIEHFGNGCFN